VIFSSFLLIPDSHLHRLSVMFGKGYCLLLGFSFITFIITVTL